MDPDDQTADPDGIREAARAIRPYLTRLLDSATAARLDEALADQLATTADPATTARLHALLAGTEDTAWFLTAVLTDAPAFRPPYQQPRYLYRQTGGRAGPAGDPGPVAADRYTCPHGDYTWYRPDVGTPIEDCPTHHIPLVHG